MAGTVKNFAPLFGKKIRITELDKCGRPNDPGDDGFVVTDGFITLTLSTETEDGNEVLVKKANGGICINKKQADAFKWFTMEIQLCDVHPVLVSWLTNAKQYVNSAGDVIGFTQGEGDIDKKFAFEMWTGTADSSCSGSQESSGYVLLPFVNGGTIGDLTVNGEDEVEFTIENAYTESGNQWGIGPYDVILDEDEEESALPNALDADDHLLMILTNMSPPSGEGEVQEMPDYDEDDLEPGDGDDDEGEG